LGLAGRQVRSRRIRQAREGNRPAAALSPSCVGGGLPPDGAAESTVRLWRYGLHQLWPRAVKHPDPATAQCKIRAAAEQADEPGLATI